MTASLRRGPRRCKPHSLSHRLAAIRRNGAAHLGTVKAYLLGKDRFREVVALALFLIYSANTQSLYSLKEKGREKIRVRKTELEIWSKFT
jgi:hypothetical protein